ncbi:hypothetical protein A0H81_03392 [Grifola frondosa]|uniref:Uncharacterized protein n=1 Tax=Grifola frondosa TaxID=5627 RepID=A0A1C7MML6_GRIFR|nr:hypothetical protein A0H81_03392 [Grifola frondosa]
MLPNIIRVIVAAARHLPIRAALSETRVIILHIHLFLLSAAACLKAWIQGTIPGMHTASHHIHSSREDTCVFPCAMFWSSAPQSNDLPFGRRINDSLSYFLRRPDAGRQSRFSISHHEKARAPWWEDVDKPAASAVLFPLSPVSVSLP